MSFVLWMKAHNFSSISLFYQNSLCRLNKLIFLKIVEYVKSLIHEIVQCLPPLRAQLTKMLRHIYLFIWNPATMTNKIRYMKLH